MDLDRLSAGEKLVAGSGILLFILSFIGPWASVDIPGLGEETASAWDLRFLTKLAILLALAAAVLAVVKAFGTNLSLPMGAGTTYLVLAGVATLLLILEVILGPASGEDAEFLEAAGVEVNRGFLLFVGLALSLVQTFGAWMHRSAEPAGPATPASPPPAA